MTLSKSCFLRRGQLKPVSEADEQPIRSRTVREPASRSQCFKPCAVIPVYNHPAAVGAVVGGVVGQQLPCIIVDDGSDAACAAVLDGLAGAAPSRITLLRHRQNLGKGAAVMTGVRCAVKAGFSHALQIDADGQHRVEDIARFLAQAASHPHALVIGSPRYDGSAPRFRLWARYLTRFWVSINTLSRRIEDAMCGFRVYPLAPLIALDRQRKLGARMNFDIEILVRLCWNGVEMINLPTAVSYPKDGVSHFRAGLDNLLITRLHATLFFGMLLRLPSLIGRKWSMP
jgi:glycosyltransferase involved in cell wall biosynthesis